MEKKGKEWKERMFEEAVKSVTERLDKLITLEERQVKLLKELYNRIY